MERSKSQSNFDINDHEADLDLARAEYETYAQQSLSKDAFLRSKEIDKEIRRNKRSSNSQFKLLVLGAGDAGKTTLVRQLTSLHKSSSSPAEIDHYAHILKLNALDAMKKLIDIGVDRGWEFPAELQASIDKVYESKEFSKNLVSDLEYARDTRHSVEISIDREGLEKAKQSEHSLKLGIVRAFVHAIAPSISHLQRLCSLFENIHRIGADDFRPTEDDILRCRVKTTGVIETLFESGGQEFMLIDVGGQRNERRKWAHFFDSVTAILFLAALDEYDMVLEEDATQNRMLEAIQLFASVTKMGSFVNTTFVLFLNKVDLFTKKIEQTKKPLEKLFSDYSGGPDAQAAAAYILKKYQRAFGGKGKLYAHTTCALDKKNCERVFNAVKETLISQSIKLSGLDT